MPGIDTAGPNAGGDELDDLFNYDIDVDEVFKDIEKKAEEQNKTAKATDDKGADLGIDEEIQIKRARKPNPKLDEPRLLSERGIPKLRKISKEKLKFKGKGHEFTDIARMLNLYQLWLDDLYPRAKFLDSLAMVEILGHTKSMQMRRKDWINEEKPKDLFLETQEQAPTVEATKDGSAPQGSVGHIASIQEPSMQDAPDKEPDNIFLSDEEAPLRHNEPDEDELDALLAEEISTITTNPKQPQAPSAPQPQLLSSTVEDELDALLAEHEADAEKENRRQRPVSKVDAPGKPVTDDFADEMEAMAEFDMW